MAAAAESSWEAVRIKHPYLIQDLSLAIPNFSYKDESAARLTEERLCSYLVERFRRAKSILFDSIHYLFEIQEEGLIPRLERLRDAVDVLSDEIKAKAFAWRPLTPELLEKVLHSDSKMVKEVEYLIKTLEGIYALAIDALKRDHKLFPLVDLGRRLSKAEEQMGEIDNAFLERDSILRPTGITRTPPSQ